MSGGGIRNEGNLDLSNATVSGNETTASYGGGIANAGPATMSLTNVTLSGNRAEGDGGGIDQGLGGLANLINVTITGNTADTDGDAGGGGGVLVAPATPSNPVGTFNFRNTIIAGNTDISPPSLSESPDCGGHPHLAGQQPDRRSRRLRVRDLGAGTGPTSIRGSGRSRTTAARPSRARSSPRARRSMRAAGVLRPPTSAAFPGRRPTSAPTSSRDAAERWSTASAPRARTGSPERAGPMASSGWAEGTSSRDAPARTGCAAVGGRDKLKGGRAAGTHSSAEGQRRLQGRATKGRAEELLSST